MAKQWRFYGRQAEIAALHSFMDKGDGFHATALHGRRQVGKTDLIRHFFQNARPDEERPVIVCHLSGEAESDDRTLFYEDLRHAVRESHANLLEDFRPVHEDENPLRNFPGLVKHLLDHGAIVVLDEFQRIAGHRGLMSWFQEAVDKVQARHRSSGMAPRLILMGSGQQRLMEMFQKGESELYARVKEQIHLRPWTFSELTEAVEDQGWNTRPDRLLTLWTAYGGMPAHWERFATLAPDLADFSLDMDDLEWTDAFLEQEDACRQLPDGSFAAKMEIELRSLDYQVLSWLAERPGGQRLHNLPDGLKAALAEEGRRDNRSGLPEDMAAREALFDILGKRLSGKHLGLVARRDAIDDSSSQRWHVADEQARFQLDVLEKAQAMAGEFDMALPGELVTTRRERLQNAEGRGLETLALAGMRHLFIAGTPDISAVPPKNLRLRTGSWRKEPAAEIDILAGDGDNRRLWGCFAKRPATEHKPDRDCRHMANWLMPLPDTRNESAARNESGQQAASYSRRNEGLAQLRDMERCMMFISPVFSDEDRQGLAEKVALACREEPAAQAVSDWFTMDIADMLSGRGPRELQPPPPPEDTPAGERHENDDGTPEP